MEKEKLSGLIKCIFTVGTGIVLTGGAMIFLGVLAAVICGGKAADILIHVIWEKIFPVFFIANVILCVLGLVHVYLIRDKGFRFEVNKE